MNVRCHLLTLLTPALLYISSLNSETSVTFFYLTLLGSGLLYYDDWDYRQYVTSEELELGSVDGVPK
jgi:hypothetical protein